MDENLLIGIPIKRKNKNVDFGLFSQFDDFVNHLVPKPNRCFAKDFSIEYELPLKVLTTGFNPDDFILKNLVEELEKKTIQVDFVSDSSIDQISTILGYKKNPTKFKPKHEKEGYSLSIQEKGLIIQSQTRQGMFYGIQTLLQIIHHMENRKTSRLLVLPGLEIYDFPAFSMRGIAEDTSRGQAPIVKAAKRYIDFLAKYKMNTYAIGYEGDNFFNEKHPKIGESVAQFLPEEIKEIDAYARERFIDLIPIYVSLGHQDNILHIPEYQDLAEFPSAQCFNISDDRIYPLIEDYIETICTSFSSTKAFHIGCDESYDVGVYKSKEFIGKKGRSTALLDHYKRIYGMAKKYGKDKIIMYHDIIANYDDVLKKLPSDLHIMFWDYFPKEKYPLLKRIFQLSKLPIILSPSHLSWCRHFPDYTASAKNIIEMVEYGKNINKQYKQKQMDTSRIVGVLNSTWGDFNNPNLRENFVYGSALSAVVGWETTKPDPKAVLHSFLFHFFQINELKLLDTLTNIVWDCANLNNQYRSGPISMPQVFYMHLFRNPFAIDGKPTHYVKKYKKMGKEANQLLHQMDSIFPQMEHNKKYLEYIRFSIKLVKILAQKEEITALSYRLSSTFNLEKNETLKSELIKKISKFQSELRDIMKEYEELWIYCAKNPVLGFNMMRFRRLDRYCFEKIDQLQKNEFNHNPFLKSEWITSKHVNKPTGVGDFYRKIIQIEKKPTVAKLLAIAGTYGRIYVNGNYVGQVLSRMSLSILPIQNRVQVFDITDLLRSGPNLVAIESYNFENIEPTFNCLIRCKIDNQIQDYISNSSWRVFVGYNPDNSDLNMISPPESSLRVPIGWNESISPEFDTEWSFVSSLGSPPKYNGHIYDEDILQGDIPITDEYFGSKAWLNWAANAYLGPIWAHLGMLFYEFVKKIIRIA